MLKTLWKVWKGLRFYHKIWAIFPHFLPVLPHILGLAVKMSMTFSRFPRSGLHVFDDVADGLPQVLVVLHVPLHGLEGVDDGGMIAAGELAADLLHAHAGDLA